MLKTTFKDQVRFLLICNNVTGNLAFVIFKWQLLFGLLLYFEMGKQVLNVVFICPPY